MKYLFSALVVWLFSMSLTAVGAEITGEEVRFYNWDEYVPEAVLDDFTKETGIRVIYKTYKSSDAMYSYVKALDGRAFDVVLASTELVERLANQGLLHHIDKAKIQAFNQIDKNLLGKGFDPDNHFSIPFLWGSTSIFYDKNKVTGEINSWNDLWDMRWRNRVLLMDYMDEIFYVTLKMLGSSGNSKNADEIKQAFGSLRKLAPNIVAVTRDLIKDMQRDDVYLGMSWNGDFVQAREKKPSLRYVYPEEGAYFWLDNLVIPARAPNLSNAYALIDYLMRPEVAAKWTTDLGYAHANLASKALLDEEIRSDPAIYPPPSALEKAEFPRDISEAGHLYGLYWGKLMEILSAETRNLDE